MSQRRIQIPCQHRRPTHRPPHGHPQRSHVHRRPPTRAHHHRRPLARPPALVHHSHGGHRAVALVQTQCPRCSRVRNARSRAHCNVNARACRMHHVCRARGAHCRRRCHRRNRRCRHMCSRRQRVCHRTTAIRHRNAHAHLRRRRAVALVQTQCPRCSRVRNARSRAHCNVNARACRMHHVCRARGAHCRRHWVCRVSLSHNRRCRHMCS